MRFVLTSLVLIIAAAPASAQEGVPAARYQFVPVEAGMLRLDTLSGEVSLCAGSGSSFSCVRAPDDGAREATDSHLADRLAALEARIAELEANRVFLDDAEAMERVGRLAEGMMQQFFGMVREMRDDLQSDTP